VLDLGNDEVYYLSYARYPQWSYFDHPPAVGWAAAWGTAQGNLLHPFFTRLVPNVLCGVNLLLVYRMAARFGGAERAAWTTVLFASSIYTQVIAGFFLMPDAPLLTSLLLSLFVASRFIPRNGMSGREAVAFGTFLGWAFLSKYHALFLWGGFLLYCMLYARHFFRSYPIYLAAVTTALWMIPVVIWNASNGFVSFVFQTDRIGPAETGLDSMGAARELLGSMAYANPIVWGIAVAAVIRMLRGTSTGDVRFDRFILCSALPLIALFLASAWFKPTLPHWSAPAYSLILVPAGLLFAPHPRWIKVAAVTMAALWCILVAVIVWVPLERLPSPPEALGKQDVTLDMVGWKNAASTLTPVLDSLRRADGLQPSSRMLITHWFPGAHTEHYLAVPLGIPIYPVGDTASLHHYAFLRNRIAPLDPHATHLYLATSRHFRDPVKQPEFTDIRCIDTLPIFKGKHHVANFFLYTVQLRASN
jgi:hypothetical protein